MYESFQFSRSSERQACGVFFFEGTFTKISTEMYRTFSDILLTITSFIIFLMHHLVVRRRRSAPPLTTSRFHAWLNGFFNNLFFWLKSGSYQVRWPQKYATDKIPILDRRCSTFRIYRIMYGLLSNFSFI